MDYADEGGSDIISAMEPNSTECVCSDLQHEDYSPLYAWFNYVLIILALPSLSVFGVLTNIVNVFVYSRKRMQSSANTYLLFLGCSDFLVILTGLFIFWIDSARSYIQELARAPYTTVYTLPFGYMAQTCSIYFTVAAAFDCYINVCWKSISHHYCNVKRAKQIVACVTICSIIYNSLRFPQFNLRKCFHDGSQEIIIEICPTTLFFTINTIYNVYMYMVLMTLLPFLFLLVLNAFIVVRQSLSPARNVLTSENFCVERTPSDFASPKASTMGILEANGTVTMKTGPTFDESSGDDTLTMIMVVVLFLCCNTLALIVNMIETFFDPDPLLLNLLSDASNFLVILNSSVNCVIYMIFNKEYRETFLLHAGRLLDYLKHQCGCCLSGGISERNSSFREHRLLYKPIASPTMTTIETSKKKRPDSLMRETNNSQKHHEYGSCQSPVWQKKLTSSSASNNASLPLREFWNTPFYCDQLVTGSTELTSPAASFMPPQNNSTEFVLMDDEGADSGCEESRSCSQCAKSPTRGRQVQKSWIAEVKIMESGDGRYDKPHIYVKPIAGFKPDNISITAL